MTFVKFSTGELSPKCTTFLFLGASSPSVPGIGRRPTLEPRGAAPAVEFLTLAILPIDSLEPRGIAAAAELLLRVLRRAPDPLDATAASPSNAPVTVTFQ